MTNTRQWSMMISGLLLAMAVQSQVQLQSLLPAAGMVQKDQLWNMLLVNGAGREISGYLQLTLRNRQTGIEELNAATAYFTVPKNGLLLNAHKAGPVQYNYITADPAALLNGLLPAGAYQACYAFMQQAGEKYEIAAEECVAFDVEPLSPPLLVFPADSAVLDVPPALFQWIPPAPAQVFTAMQYDILITEVNPAQRPAEAIQENMPFFSRGGLLTNSMSYTSAAFAFEKNKWYAWQIVARDSRGYAASSGVNVFRIKNNDSAATAGGAVRFAELRPAAEQPVLSMVSSGQLFLRFYNYSAAQQATLKLYDAAGKERQTLKKQLAYGDNLLRIVLDKKWQAGNIYTAELTDKEGKKYKALFQLTTNP